MILIEQAINILMIILSASLLVAAIRLMSGPGVPDRIVALEVILMHGVGLVALYAIRTGQHAALDIVLVLTLVGFLGIAAMTRYIEQGGR